MIAPKRQTLLQPPTPARRLAAPKKPVRRSARDNNDPRVDVARSDAATRRSKSALGPSAKTRDSDASFRQRSESRLKTKAEYKEPEHPPTRDLTDAKNSDNGLLGAGSPLKTDVVRTRVGGTLSKKAGYERVKTEGGPTNFCSQRQAKMLQLTATVISGIEAELHCCSSTTILHLKEMLAPQIGIHPYAMTLMQTSCEADLSNAKTLEQCGIENGSVLIVAQDPLVLNYGESIGFFSNQNAGKGKDGQGTRLDVSIECVKKEAKADTDYWATRIIMQNVNARNSTAPMRMGEEVAIFSEDKRKRVDMGYYCVTDAPAARDNANTRLCVGRLDGPSEGPICYGHKVGIFSEDGEKRLDMSTMGDPNHESWATRVFVLALRDGEIVEDVECKGST